MSDRPVDASYRVRSVAEQRAAYDDWAARYEGDLCAMGYRIPAATYRVNTAALARLEAAGAWRPVFATAPFASMPYGEPDIRHQIHCYEVTQ